MFKPMFDMVMIQMEIAPEKTKGGLYLPEQVRKVPDQGEVIAIGEDVQKLKKGDKVIFGKYVGIQLTIKDQEGLLLIHETDVLGIMEGEE